MKYISKFDGFYPITESLKYHIENKIGLLESIFRIESDAWLDLVNETRVLFLENKIDISEDDKWLISTFVGEKGIFEGEEVLLDIPFEEDNEWISEAEYRGRKVNLNRPFRTPGGPKKFAVYTKNAKGNVVKVTFGDPNLKVKNYDPKRAKSFRARHKCDSPGPKWKARYWSCNLSRYRRLLNLKSSRSW